MFVIVRLEAVLASFQLKKISDEMGMNQSIAILTSDSPLDVLLDENERRAAEIDEETDDLTEKAKNAGNGDDGAMNVEARESEGSELNLFPLPAAQEKFEKDVRDAFGEILEFLNASLNDYQLPATACPYCGEKLDFATVTCKNNHFVETCSRTFLPLTDLSASMKCYYCSLSCYRFGSPALGGKENGQGFGWIINDDRCSLSGHCLQKPKYA